MTNSPVLNKASSYFELNLQECGREICVPDKAIVLSRKQYHLFHYVISGKGIFKMNGTIYHIHRGMIFYIPPDTDAEYAPDKEDPWTYEWIGVDGAMLNEFLSGSGISLSAPLIYDQDDRTYRKFFDGIFMEYSSIGFLDVVCLGLAYQFFGTLINLSHTHVPNNYGSLLLKVDYFFLFHLLVHRFVSFKRSPIIELLRNNKRRPIWILTHFY